MSPELWLALFGQNPHPMWVFDVETLEFLDVNEAAIRHYGYSRAEFLAMRVADICSPDLADATPDPDAGRGALKPAQTQRYRLKTGEIINAEIASHTVTFEGRPAILVSTRDVCCDVSERIRADCALEESERMRFALEASRVGIWETNVTTSVAYWSETNEVMHGLAPGTFGRTIQAFVDCIHPDDRERVLRAVEEAKRARTATEYQYRTISPDGTERWITSTAQFFYDEAGAPIRGTGV